MPSRPRQYLDLSRPIRRFTFVVDATEAGQRVDAVLRAHYPWHSRTTYQRKVKRGEVTVDDVPAKASTRVRKGQCVAVSLGQDDNQPEAESGDDLVILYEDEHLVAVDKPSGMPCHPVGRTRHSTLINKLHARHKAQGSPAGSVPRLGHRLDRDTSGVVLCVKHREADIHLTELFTAREVQKTYLALTAGVPPTPEGIVDAPLGPDPTADTRLHQRVDPEGAPARSTWRTLQAWPHLAWLALSPHTGRTHQLRVHMAHVGCPLVGDHLYGDLRPLTRSRVQGTWADAADEVLLDRLGLHAHRLETRHPMTGAPLVIESPVPADLRDAVRALEQIHGTSSRQRRPA